MDGSNGTNGTSGSDTAGLIAGGLARTQGMTNSQHFNVTQPDGRTS